MKKKFFVALTMALLLLLSSCSVMQPRWRTFTVEDGLANESVFSIIESSDGMLWFGTYGGGISRFDGSSWQNYPTGRENATADNCNQIFSLAIGDENELLYGTNGCHAGVIQFDENDWSVHNMQRYPVNAGSFVYSLSKDREGGIWFGTLAIEIIGEVSYQSEGGLARYDGTSWTTYLEEYSIYSVLMLQDGSLWFGTDVGGAFLYDGETWTNYTENDGLTSSQVIDIAVEPSGAMWFGGEGGISRYDGQTWSNYSSANGLISSHVSSIAVDAAGGVWVGTLDKGVSYFRNNRWENYTVEDGLGSNKVQDILVASDGIVWFATDGGVTQYRH